MRTRVVGQACNLRRIFNPPGRATNLIGLGTVAATAVFVSACSDIDRVAKGHADNTGDFPTTEQALVALRHKPAGVRGWAGPYIQQEPPRDLSGHEYIYTYPGQVSVLREAR